MGRLISVVLVLAAAQVEAQIVRVTSTSEGQQVCRIVNGRRECETVQTVEYGTGVIVGRDASNDYVLTAKHVLSYGQNAVHGRPAELVAKHPTEDIALLRIARTTWDVATLGDDPPIGLAVYLDGLGGSGKADANDYRQARGQIISTDTVSHPSRYGDSGGGVSVGSTLYGVIWATSATQTRFIPVSVCRPFCLRWGVPCQPPAAGRVAPFQDAAPAPPRDIPDRQKVLRIEQLESEQRTDRQRLDELIVLMRGLTESSSKLSVRIERLEGRPEFPVADIARLRSGLEHLKGQAERPVEVWIETLDGKVVAKKVYPRGTPIRLRLSEKVLTGGGKNGK